MQKKSQGPLISVIVPIYNVAPYLSKCIDSIRDQTYTNLEIILVDDGSTDNSAEICDAFQKCDKRIKVIHKANQGLVSARKAGIMEALGEYSTYVDGDDWIEPDMYEAMFTNLNNSDVVICGVVRHYGLSVGYRTNKIGAGVFEGKSIETIYKSMIYTGPFFQENILPYVHNVLFRTEILRKNQLSVPDTIRVGEDRVCLYPSLLNAKKIVVLDKCLYHHRLRADSIMGTNDGKEIERYKVVFSYLQNIFLQYDKWKDDLISQLKYQMVYMLLMKNMEVFRNQENLLFPYSGIEKKSKIAVYGAGRYGCELVKHIKSIDEYTLIAWVDKNSRENIQKPDVLKEMKFDYVLVAVLINKLQEEMFSYLVSLGIPQDKIKMIDMELIETGKNWVEDILS